MTSFVASMNLSVIVVPPKCKDAILLFQSYYQKFYIEMVRLSNQDLNDSVRRYLDQLQYFAKSADPSDKIKACFGVVALHVFGFKDFNRLTEIFDRLIPQTDRELVKFTSWCAGRLIHHPRDEQARYVSHLFGRALGWIQATGRRARPLAAVNLIRAISSHAGNCCSIYLSGLTTASWKLVSHPSHLVLRDTAECYGAFTRALMRYGRYDLQSLLEFLYMLGIKLLAFEAPVRAYAALLLFQQLLPSYPDFFVAYAQELWSCFQQCFEESKNELLIQCAAFCASACLCVVDAKFFELIADEVFQQAQTTILEFDKETVKYLCLLAAKVPDIVQQRVDMMMQFAKDLVQNELFDPAFQLLRNVVLVFDTTTQLSSEILANMAKAEITKEYQLFIVDYLNYFPDTSSNLRERIIEKVSTGLKGDRKLPTLELLAVLPDAILKGDSNLVGLIESLSSHPDNAIRCTVPRALFNTAKMSGTIDTGSIFRKLLKHATYEQSHYVRESILQVIYDNICHELGQPEFLELLRVFVNDDSTTVRQVALKILGKLSAWNPISTYSLIRSVLLDSFFILNNVISIRKRASAAKVLPDVVAAAGSNIKIYSGQFITVFIEALKPSPILFDNFVEENAQDTIVIRLLDTLALLAQLDPKAVISNVDKIIPLLINQLLPQSHRLIILSVLKVFTVLLSAPCSSVEVRTQVPFILPACASILASTRSRKARKATLRVIGAIGVVDVHQKAQSKCSDESQNFDDELARQFYHPERDKVGMIADLLLLNDSKHAEYYLTVSVTALLKIFDDELLEWLYLDIAQALVHILAMPKLVGQTLTLFDQFVTRFLDVMTRSSDEKFKEYLPVYCQLIIRSGHNTVPFVKQSLEIFHARFCDDLLVGLLNMLLVLVKALGESFSPYCPEVVAMLICCLNDWKTSSVEISRRVLEIFAVIGEFAVDQQYLIIPQICDAVLCQQTISSVRVMSLDTLSILLKKCSMNPYIGPMVRAAAFGLECQDENTVQASKCVFSLIIQHHKYLCIDDPEYKYWQSEAKLTNIASTASVDDRDVESWFVPHQLEAVDEQHVFSKQAILGRFTAMNLGSPQQLEMWLYGVIQTFVISSTSPVIRACAPLVNLCHAFALEIFNPAFYSCWCQLSESEHALISWTFEEILSSEVNYETVARAVLNLLMYMHKVHKPIKIPLRVIVSAGNRYGAPFYAIKILEDRAVDGKTISESDATTLLDMFVKLGKIPQGNAIYNTFTTIQRNHELLLKLKMWDQAQRYFEEAYQKGRKTLDVFSGLVMSLSALFKWDTLLTYLKDFHMQNRDKKDKTSMYFAEAAMQLGRWDDLSQVLKATPVDSVECTTLSAFNALHNQKWEKVGQLVDRGFALLASRPIHFGGDENRIHMDMMLASQQLIEITEMMEWLRSEEKRNGIEEVWNERLKTAPRNFETWFRILSWRTQITKSESQSCIQLFQMGSAHINMNAFNVLFPEFKFEEASDIAKISYLVTQWASGDQRETIEQMRKLLETVSPSYRKQCIVFFSEWLVSSDDSITTLMEAHRHLSEIMNDSAFCSKRGCVRFCCSMDSPLLSPHIRKERSARVLAMPDSVMKDLTTDVLDVDVLRNWAAVNIGLMKASFDTTSFDRYVTNAIQALVRCCEIAPSFPDVVQLLSLFFENANQDNIFNSTAQSIALLQPKLLLQVAQQILVQLSHPCKHVQRFVHSLILTLMTAHFHGLVASVIVFTLSKNESRARGATEITKQFVQKQPEIWYEVNLVRDCLLRTSITIYEKSLRRIERAVDYAENQDYKKMRKTLNNLARSAEDRSCEMHRAFADTFSYELELLKKILSHTNEQTFARTAKQWCAQINNQLMTIVNKFTSIQLSSLSEELCDKDSFLLAVPGTYKPDKPVIHMKYFVQQVVVYMSKQQPKVVVIKGTDGHFYQFLLKGQEDLRLDERLMQFFRMINSFLKRESLLVGNQIRIINVITLSMKHGMVQWVTGTDTLRFIVEEYRKSVGRELQPEHGLLRKYGVESYNALLPIQKYQIVSKICREIPDTDLANFMWLKAASAEVWMNQMDMFSVTAGMTSIVGYIIGLGDRHPSNILIDRLTGEVIHIDFGDSFERAMKRRVLPELVPFRLTRMMVRAMGVTGPEGSFKTAFMNMAAMLRARRGILLTVLSIFVQEPLSDADHSAEDQQPAEPRFYQTRSNSSHHCLSSAFDDGRIRDPYETAQILSHKESRRRVKEKLMGYDLPDQLHANTVEEQANLLIAEATNTYSQAKMYHGWFPFW